MIKIISLIFVFLYLFLPQQSYACSIAYPITEFKLTKEKALIPQQPDFKLISILRGSKIISNISCGMMVTMGVIKFELQTIPKNKQGYIFQIVEGNIGDNSIFSSYPITLSNFVKSEKYYDFMWSDYPRYYRKPIKAKIKIIAVSSSGRKSTPQYIQTTIINNKREQTPINKSVQNIQRKLKSLGLYTGKTDGKQNEEIEKSIRFLLKNVYMKE